MFIFEVLDQFYSVIEGLTAANTRKPPKLREVCTVITSHMLLKVISPAVRLMAALRVTGKLLGRIRTRASHLLRHICPVHPSRAFTVEIARARFRYAIRHSDTTWLTITKAEQPELPLHGLLQPA